MKTSRRQFIQKFSAYFGAVLFPLHKSLAGMIPFGFLKTQRGVLQVTQLVVKAVAKGGSTNIRTTQVLAKVAAVGGNYDLRTTQVIAKVVAVGGNYDVRTTQVVVKVAVIP